MNRRFKVSLSITCTHIAPINARIVITTTAIYQNYYIITQFLLTGLINYMKFDASGKYLFVCGDRAVRILHNVCGYQTTIASCIRLQGTKQTSATIERQKKTIEECKQALAKFGK